MTNFDHDPDMNVTDPAQKSKHRSISQCHIFIHPLIGFPWCGYMINMTDLSVSADYTRYHETCESSLCLPRERSRLMTYADLQDSLTVERGRRPGVTFVHKMMQYDSWYWR